MLKNRNLSEENQDAIVVGIAIAAATAIVTALVDLWVTRIKAQAQLAETAAAEPEVTE